MHVMVAVSGCTSSSMAVNPYPGRSRRPHRLATMTRRNLLLLMGGLGALGSVLFGGVEI